MPRPNPHIIIDLVPPRQKIWKYIKIGSWKTLFGRRSQARTLTDGQVNGPEPLCPLKKGRLFGKSGVSDFVRRISGNTLLTKALNHYLSSISVDSAFINSNPESVIPVAQINYLLFQLCETVKVLGGDLTGKLNLITGYTLNHLDINHWPSLGLEAHLAVPILLLKRV